MPYLGDFALKLLIKANSYTTDNCSPKFTFVM